MRLDRGQELFQIEGGMTTNSRRLVDKLWSYCDVLRDDGVGVLEYTEQLTYLLFLKMAHERATRGGGVSSTVRRRTRA